MSYNVGSAYLQIVPSFAGFAQAVDRQMAQIGTQASKAFSGTFNEGVKRGTNDAQIGPSDSSSSKQGNTAAGKFADSFKARLEAALKALPEINLDADPSEAEAKIAEIRWQLEELSGQRIGIDVDEATALAQLDRLKSELDEVAARSPSVRVQVDTGAASAELAAFKAEVDAVGSDGGGGFGGLASSLGEIDGGAVAAGAGIAALGAIAIPVGAALVASFAGVATVFGAIAGGAGVLALGLSGVSKTVGLLDQQQSAATKTGTSYTSSLDQQASAQRQLAQSERSLAETRTQAATEQRQAAQQVQQAEYSLTQANQNSLAAQEALNQAREQAKQDLQSYANAAVDANLTLQQSHIDLANAQQQYASDTAANQTTPGSVSATQLEQDQLNIAKAQQAIVEAQQQLTQANQASTQAQKDGVNGAPGVIAAEKQVAQAKHDQAAAAQAVANARRNEADQAQRSADAIKNAEDSVKAAMQAVATASKGAGTAGSSSLASIDAQLAKVNPATLQLAEFVRNQLEPAFNKLKNAAAAGLLPGLESGLKDLAPLAGPLTEFVGSLAKTMGTLFEQSSKALTGPFWTQFFGWVDKIAGPTLSRFMTILGNLGKGFAGLLEAFSPVTTAIGKGLDDLTGKFASFGAHAGDKNSPFQSFLAYVKQYGPAVADLFGKLAETAGKLVAGFAPLGGTVLKAANAIASLLGKLSPSTLRDIAYAAGAIFVAFKASAISALVDGLAGIANGFKVLTGAEIGADAAADANPIGAVVLAIEGLAGAIAFAVVEIVKHWSDIEKAFSDAWDWVKGTFTKLWDGAENIITSPVTTAVAEIGKHWGSIEDAFSAGWDWVKSTFTKLWDGAENIITSPVTSAFGAIKSGWSDVKQFLTGEWTSFKTIAGKLWGDIATAASKAWGGITGLVSGVWNKVEGIFTTGVDWVATKILLPLVKVLDDVLSTFGVHLLSGAEKDLQNLASSSQSGSPSGGKHSLGGTAPGFAPGRDSLLALVSPGEGFIVPEAVRGLGGPAAIQAINAAFSDRVSPPPGFSLGGVAEGVGGFFSGLGQDIAGAGSGALNLARSGLADVAVGGLDAAEAPIKLALSAAPSQFAHALATGLFNRVNALVKAFISGHDKSSGSSSGGRAIPTAQHKQLIDEALKAASVPASAANEDAVNLIVTHESSPPWNPSSINNWDSNWQAGHPSVGLMQVIAGNFQRYITSQFANVGPFAYGVSEDPVANMVAGIRYAIATYGSLQNVPGVLAVDSGQPYVPYDSGGWLPPGVTAAVNNTGKPEPIFTHSQAQALMGAASRGSEVSFPDRVTLVDADGSILTKARVQASRIVSNHDRGTAKLVQRNLPGRGGGGIAPGRI